VQPFSPPAEAFEIARLESALAAMTAERDAARAALKLAESDYDSGLLNDWGGGDVYWWQNYIRSEVARCNDHWRRIVDQLPEACKANAGHQILSEAK
jgi:hypothetical protein